MNNPLLAAVKPSPRVKMAAQLYASGALPTKKAASEAAGLHPNYLTMLTNAGNEQVEQIITETQRMIQDESIEMSQILQVLGRKAVSKLATLMEHSASEKVQLEAAKDLADRAPQTSKVQKHETLSLTIEGENAKQLAEALVASAQARKTYAPLVESGDFTPGADTSTDVPTTPSTESQGE